MDMQYRYNQNKSEVGIRAEAQRGHTIRDLPARVQIWLFEGIRESGMCNILLLRRGMECAESPGRFTTVCNDVVAPDETFEAAANRIIAADLNMSPPADYPMTVDFSRVLTREIGGEQVLAREDCRVFLLDQENMPHLFPSVTPYGVLDWQDAQQLLHALQTEDPAYSIDYDLYQRILGTYMGVRMYTIHVTDPWSAPGASYAGSDEWSYHACYSHFGTKESAMQEGKGYVTSFHENMSPYLASVTFWLT